MVSEKEILDLCKRSPREGQRVLYLRYAPMLKSVCRRYLKDSADVQDLLQDSFLKIFSKLSSFQGNGSFEGWLKRIAVNTILDFMNERKERGWGHVLEMDISEESNIEEEGQIVDQLMEAGFTKESLLELLYKLPHPYSVAFNMYFIDEISHREIADFLHTSEANSRKLVFRAKDQMKVVLVEYLKEQKSNLLWIKKAR